ncbi:hypothetical protein [Adhaeribacter pallidiroseus]|uniref:Uncharacterized protein n=1 Tax=Adhaeribacter pallidiroseus TaxID=2072847 RepID=A0A369QBI9_9BACT|nr:hypothetical protein [Adhaeribacter pallidiroseus]RDC61700.1 hypothetical protein AHMF7616_00280 [Adhaeribacter pallidiroseus]
MEFLSRSISATKRCILQARRVLEPTVFLDNYKHSYLSWVMLAPEQVHPQTEQLKRRWTNYLKKYLATLADNEDWRNQYWST